jgi:hypothetical protein
MASLFFSYSHADEALRDQLEKHLKILQRQGIIETWHDRRIEAGSELHSEIDDKLRTADIILLLVSSDFLASDYCHEVEMRLSMERHEKGETTVIPVILRPCDWHDTLFGKLMATPRDGKPVTKYADRDEAFLEIEQSIKSVAKKLNKETPTPKKPSAPSQVHKTSPRSSNLSIHREFTDHQRDQFLDEAFTYMGNFFESSLQELQRRNPEITTRFKQIDAHRFTASAYKHGKMVSECTIWLGGRGSFANGIAYTNGYTTSSNSHNASLAVDDDGTELYLKSYLSMRNDEDKFTIVGGAEHFWEKFMEPLQRD